MWHSISLLTWQWQKNFLLFVPRMQALEGVAVREALSRVDVKENIAKCAALLLRRHKRHHAPKARADEA